MDQAIFESTTGTIFGVKGNWLYQFNATTGALMNSTTFTSDAQSPSTIATIGGNLYIGVTNTAFVDWNNVSFFLSRDIFVVSASTLSVTGRFNFGNKLNQSDWGPNPVAGWRSLVSAGSLLFGFIDTNNTTHNDVFSVLPSNLPGYSTSGHAAQIGETTDICNDSGNSRIWGVSGDGGVIWAFSNDGAFSGYGQTNVTYPPYAFGVTFNAAQNAAYAATCTQKIFKVSTPGGSLTTLDTGRSNCNAFRIKSVNNQSGNSYNGKVLIPAYADNTVLVWDPGSDTLASTLTGFSFPFDIVICPTKCFALQTGVNGLVALP